MKNEEHKSGSFLSSIMKAVGLRPRRKMRNSNLDLFGMGGTFGRAHIKHCSTWDIEIDLPPAPKIGRDICSMANRRREAANNNHKNEKTSSRNRNVR